MTVRLQTRQRDIATKRDAANAFAVAVGKINSVFDAAAANLTNPSPKETQPEVLVFAKQVRDAHDKIKTAFGGH